MLDDNAPKQPNGVLVVEAASDDSEEQTQELTIFTIINRLISAIFFPGPDSYVSLRQRIKASVPDNVPLLRDDSRNTARHFLIWVRRGSPLLALLAVSVGTIVSLTLAGLLVFMIFFVAATVNAIVISLVISLAAVGGLLVMFFACLAVIYVVALSVAVFVISTATISCIIAVLIATGWIGFFCTVLLVAEKSIGLAKHAVFVTGSALSAYSTARLGHVSKKSD